MNRTAVQKDATPPPLPLAHTHTHGRTFTHQCMFSAFRPGTTLLVLKHKRATTTLPFQVSCCVPLTWQHAVPGSSSRRSHNLTIPGRGKREKVVGSPRGPRCGTSLRRKKKEKKKLRQAGIQKGKKRRPLFLAERLRKRSLTQLLKLAAPSPSLSLPLTPYLSLSLCP